MSLMSYFKPRFSGAFYIACLTLFAPAFISVACAQDANDMAPPVRDTVSTDAGVRKQLNAIGLTGSLRGGYWSSNRLYDDVSNIGTGSVWLKLDKKLSNGIGLFAEGFAAREDMRSTGNSRNRLREAYVETRSGAFDFRVGKQIIAWGRTDRLNPTDNLTPRDARLMAADVDEDRFGSMAGKASWNMDAYTSITGIWLPEFQPNTLFLRSGLKETVPNSRRQWAVKFDQSGKDLDWSVSYFDGYDLNGDLSAARVLKHYRTQVLGVDAATTRGSYRFAVESAFTRTEDPTGTDDFIKNPFLYTVMGVERDFGNNTSGIVQVFNRTVSNYSQPPTAARLHAILANQLDRTQNGVSIRIAKKWWNETLETELSGVSLLNRHGYLIRPRMTYLWSDQVKILSGYEYYQGSNDTLYGLLNKNSLLFIEMRYFY
ncbi:MAG: hypothetical protein LW714_05165 [Oxalobacteraceae bacterium]|jgi:hypothetical protein|nr:hypothetical protein [Oxalobacteraceae bacterium]